MQSIRKVEVQPYEGARLPYRIAVGDVIRCSAFANCFLFNHPIRSLSGKLWVWRSSESHLRYREQCGEGVGDVEPARAKSTYLVEQIKMTVGDGPHDVFPNQYRMSRDVSCLRLTDDFTLPEKEERICFSLNEAMALCGIQESEIELVGWATLPIVWEET
ncbi:MAG TPA: hypothetical protein PKZ32_08735 [Candidatus Melainabacteria bacterium]|nr:hypothetical protein [Candidatus Melainabacteria bacterium]